MTALRTSLAGLICMVSVMSCSGQSPDEAGTPGGEDVDSASWVWTAPMNGHLGQAVHHHGLAAHADGAASFSLQFWELEVAGQELQWVGSEDGVGGQVVLTIEPSGVVRGAEGWDRATRYRNRIASDRDNQFALVRFPADVPTGEVSDAAVVWRGSDGVDAAEVSMPLVDAWMWGTALDLGQEGTLAVHAGVHLDAISTFPQQGIGWTTKVPRSTNGSGGAAGEGELGAAFVHALTHDLDGNVYALVMEENRLLKLSGAGAVEWSTPLDQEQSSAFGIALRVAGDGSIIAIVKGVESAGTEWLLRVHQVSADGEVVADSTAATLHPDGKFSAAAVAPDGGIFASGHCHADSGIFGVESPWRRESCQSFIVGFSPDGVATELWTGPANSRVMALSVDSTGGLVAVSAEADSVHLNRHITDGVLRVERFEL